MSPFPSRSGTITGTIGANADSGGPYIATVTATDANTNASVSRVFTWNISPPAVPGTIQYFPIGLSLVVNQPGPSRTWGQWGEIIGDGFRGLGDGYVMVFNAQLNAITFGNSPLQGTVDQSIAVNGGAYRVASLSASGGVAILTLVGGSGAANTYRSLQVARSAQNARLFDQVQRSLAAARQVELAGDTARAAAHRARAMEIFELIWSGR
jgi:hypothetical protein